MMNKRFLMAGTAISLCFGLGANNANAQQSNATANELVFEEIIVTVRRKEESIYEAPIALSAFTSNDFTKGNIDDVYDIGKHVPNLLVNNFGIGNLSHIGVFIRGIGQQDHLITTDPGVGLYLDGVYLGRNVGANLDLINVENVVVARGPQGTLFGRNAIGGAINVVTKQPSLDSAEGEVRLRAGTRERINGAFYANFPIGDYTALSISGGYNRRGGIGEFPNLPNAGIEVGETDQLSARASLLYSPNEDVRITLSADVTDGNYGQTPNFMDLVPGFGAIDPSEIPSDNDDSFVERLDVIRSSSNVYGFSLTADIDIDENYSLKAITSYRNNEYTGGLDITIARDFISFPESGEADQFTGELQLNGTFDNWDFVTGVYYFYEDGGNVSSPFTFFAPGGFLDLNQTTNSVAAFGSATVALSEKLSLTGGARITYDDKEADTFIGGFAQREFREDDWSAFTWDLSLTYQLDSGLNFYATTQRGYQAGGFPPRNFGGPAGFVSFDPQFSQNYEIGLKGPLSDNLVVSLAAFYTDYTDLQVQVLDVGPLGFATFTDNAGKARSIGAELDASLIFSENFEIQTSIGYLDAEIRELDPTVTSTTVGSEPQLSPKWTVAVSPEFRTPLANGGEVSFRADFSYRSSAFGNVLNEVPVVGVTQGNIVPSRTLVGFNLQYQSPDESWTVSLYGDNIFNEVYITSSSTVNFLGYTQNTLSNDRSEFGLKFSKKFGG